MLRAKLCVLSVAASVALAGFGVLNSFSSPTVLDPRLELIKLGDLSKDCGLLKNELMKNELIKNELLKNELMKNELIKNELIKNELMKNELLKNELGGMLL